MKIAETMNILLLVLLVGNYLRVLLKMIIRKRLNLFDMVSASIVCPPFYAVVWGYSQSCRK